MAGLIPFNKKSNQLSTGFSDFQNMLDDFFNDGWWPSRNLMRDTFKIDVKETDKDYLIEAELPGVSKDEVELDIDNGSLRISVRKEENINDESKGYIHRERRTSSMSRNIYLADAKSENIKAKLENGILTVTVPKQEKTDHASKIDIE